MSYPKPLHWWTDNVLPLVYDESLSYYEVLNKIVTYINGITQDTQELTTLVNELKEIVENADLDDIPEVLAKMDIIDERLDGTDFAIRQLEGEINDLRTTVAGISTDVNNLTQDNTQNKADIADLKTDNTQNKADITDLKTNDVENKADIIRLKSTSTDYEGLVYNGTPTNNDILFTTDDVAVGDVLYYSMEMTVGQITSILFMDSNDNRIGYIGRNNATKGWLEYEGAIIVPENFDHAVAQITQAGTVKINYICKNPSPEMIRRYLHNLLDAFNYGKEYLSPGYRLRISDGTAVTSSNNSITGYYSVLPGDVITVSDFIGTTGYGIGFYDVNQQFLYGKQSSMETMTLVVPDNVFYMRYTVLNANAAQIVNIYRGNEIVEKCGHLYKKKAMTFGDSITYWDGKVFNFGKENGVFAIGYQTYMRACGMEVINKGVSGADMTEMNPVIKNADYTGVDIVTITSGANDSKDNVPLGAIAGIGSTFDTTTFYGALQDAIEYIYTQSETIEIVLMTPIKGTYGTNGKVKQEIAEAIKEVGGLYGLPVCDWYNNSGINELTFDTYINDLPGGSYMLHPTRAGYKRMADILIPFLKNLETNEIKKTFR